NHGHGKPLTRTSHRSSQGIFSHRCLRKASAAAPGITGLGGSTGIVGSETNFCTSFGGKRVQRFGRWKVARNSSVMVRTRKSPMASSKPSATIYFDAFLLNAHI